MNPLIILIRGIPGSGKSYIAHELANKLGQGVILLDPDAIDLNSDDYARHIEQMKKDNVDPKLHAYRFLRGQAYQGIKEGKTIVWNQPFTNPEIFRKMTDNLYAQASQYRAPLRILVVEVEIDAELAKKRITSRKENGGHGPSEDTFNRFVRDYRTLANDGYETITVHGDNDVQASIQSIAEAIDNPVSH